jgi:hypothetical protein
MLKWLKVLLSLGILGTITPTARAASVGFGTGWGDSLINLGTGYGPIALDGEVAFTNTISGIAGLGFVGNAFYAGLGSRIYTEEELKGFFVSLKANYFSGLALSGYGMHFTGGYRWFVPTTFRPLEFDLEGGISPYYQIANVSNLKPLCGSSNFCWGFSFGGRMAIRLTDPPETPVLVPFVEGQ